VQAPKGEPVFQEINESRVVKRPPEGFPSGVTTKEKMHWGVEHQKKTPWGVNRFIRVEGGSPMKCMQTAVVREGAGSKEAQSAGSRTLETGGEKGL